MSLDTPLLELVVSHVRAHPRAREEDAAPIDLPPIEIGHFVELTPRHYAAYQGRNPTTGERVLVPGSWLLRLEPHRTFRAHLESHGALPPLQVPGHPQLEAALEATRASLLAHRRATFPELGTILLKQTPKGVHVLRLEGLEVDRDEHPDHPFHLFHAALNAALR